MARNVPEKPSLEGIEAKWTERWEADGTYRFDRQKPREEMFAVDTPPPTVSGQLHIGHCCSYTQTDVLVRFRRMRGFEVFYPMGWDDNGLNVERRVQIHYGVYCDPTQPYAEGFEPPGEKAKKQVPVSRPNFVELCDELTETLEQAYKDLWTALGLSVDWSQTYTTIGTKATRTSQYSFLDLLDRELIYAAEAPTLWDVDFRTAVAQAELEDREIPGAYHRIAFHKADGSGPVYIETTRPELIPACVALVAHPDDDRYKPLFGTEVFSPLFGARIPVKGHELAEPEKGSGIAMICTFGDTTDVTWWRELDLPVRSVVAPDGRLLPITWGAPGWESRDPAAAQTAYDQLTGKTVKQAQKQIVELLSESGDLDGEPRPITHAVKFWENGTRPLEIITNRQWFIRTTPFRDDFARRGEELRWHPGFMKVRYQDWVSGLAGDWNITRQRFFGVPFPVWYPVGDDGEVQWDEPILAARDALPVDPSNDIPPGYDEDQRGKPGGFVGDPNVMDTWATSSLTPQIVAGWPDDTELFEKLFPFDLRPQAHDIIRTWLFYTIVRSQFAHDSLPWSDATISGFVYDPDRKKLSKSAGNSPDDPPVVVAENGADAVRYWAAGGRLGMDQAFDRNQLKIGRRLAIKLLNVSKFVLGFEPAPEDADVTEPVDQDLLKRLAVVVEEATQAFEAYDYTRALERTETFFWSFCDDYVELVKGRAYGGQGEDRSASARRALELALSTLLRLFAPFLAFTTEEVWSWWQKGSVHRAAWPVPSELGPAVTADVEGTFEVAAEVLAEIRRAKSEAKKSMRAQVDSVVVRGMPERLELLRRAEADLREAGNARELRMEEADEFTVEVDLAEAS